MNADEAVAGEAYDEAIPIETDDEEELSTPGSSQAGSPAQSPQQARSPPKAQQGGKAKAEKGEDESGSESGSEDGSSTSESSDEEGKARKSEPAGAYNPSDYSNMNVSPEMEEAFKLITNYKPHSIELDAPLKPFIPELIPSVGEVDACLKMPRPDGAESGLGTVRLDEPTLNPSDPSILDLQLRSLSKAQDLQPMDIRSIEHAQKNPKEIENWVKRIETLNRGKPAPTVQYSRRMPDIEQLMQVWPAEFEEYLQQNPLPDMADLETDLPSYIRIIASILDVPVHNQLTETLHVILTLYSEFKSNQHFAKAETGHMGEADAYTFPGAPNPGAVFGRGESMAPSRAPSPEGRR
mmetsp:Transcript_39867/g.71661  ORF Transcript_39867/g.71661 Transcript_39867/m.71661 type:complete len:352 (+) Transcript_39867:84-1139(+)|eukprot:CAMPEP_0197662622 /NCGR_PEP_ID=MMETSP1338-20131121/54153_1 /TAXON_ID=43686 ORGANISM="Pelagodinium beii, Strain RCC1491" /NCGR_SAMPLE_ID=MMETSP1338 /ASSEMBLY_ACC=CAM_ASM_000754 /LENGTH=351 /DNA_ID=CAMNT_0043240549 /DNA_START=80 /DNA_END=1135 /DNA_ORIENTATION=-